MLAEKFFKMEEEFQLFELKTADNIFFWDLVRMHIYLKYHFPEVVSPKNSNKKTIKSIYYHLVGLINSFVYVIKCRGKNLVFPCSRYIDENGLYFDKAAMNTIDYLGKDNCFILEWHDYSRKYKYQSANNYAGLFVKFYSIKTRISEAQFRVISEATVQYFGECKANLAELNEILRIFKAEFWFYKKFLKWFKIDRIFLTQNGLQKGLIQAAHNNNIEVYEFQHGSFEIDHLGYAYPDSINAASNICFPDYLLTFGDYWGSYFNIPAKEIIVAGNDYFYYEDQVATPSNQILVVSSIIHGKDLAPLTIELAKKYPDKKFIFKLHSNEYYMFDEYYSSFKELNNIQLVKNEIPIKRLLEQTELVILINSTVIYEALDMNKKVAVLKIENYFNTKINHSIFSNLYFISSIEDITSILFSIINKRQGRFFSKFSELKLNLKSLDEKSV